MSVFLPVGGGVVLHSAPVIISRKPDATSCRADTDHTVAVEMFSLSLRLRRVCMVCVRVVCAYTHPGGRRLVEEEPLHSRPSHPNPQFFFLDVQFRI